MRVLGINGSPRERGNTGALVERVLEGARSAGAETETLFLGRLTIRECDGCHACWQGKPCSKKDDMVGLFERIAAADAILFGTPVYWYGPTALMKAFIDRFVYFNCPANRPLIRGKRVAMAIPYEEEGEEAASLLLTFFEKCFGYLDVEPAGRVLAPGLTRKGEVREQPDRMDQAFRLGVALASPTPPSLGGPGGPTPPSLGGPGGPTPPGVGGPGGPP